jgi:hypothetical protein
MHAHERYEHGQSCAQTSEPHAESRVFNRGVLGDKIDGRSREGGF